MSFQEELETICQDMPDCLAAVLMNIEGLVVTQHVPQPSDLDIELLLVEMTNGLKQLISAVASADGGSLGDISLNFSKGSLVVRFLDEEHFVGMLMRPSGIIGKGRYLLRRHGLALRQELA
jgi:predicted regulator of Ras-like GTPase activity (Roadblock/LC7/MglB family)